MKKLIGVLLVIALIASLGVSASFAGEKKYKIALVFKALDSEFWKAMEKGAKDAAKNLPEVDLIILAPDREINVAQQIQILEDLITKKVDALCVAPCGAKEVIPTLEKAYKAGIPVLLIDTNAPWPKKKTFIGTDNKMGGKLAGEFIAKKLHGKGKVALITGVMGHQTHIDRVTGCEEVLKKYPNIKIVAKQPANSERALGMQVMENILTAHPDVNAVFATNDQMALGALEAIEAAGKKGIIVVGFDAVPEACKAIKEGRLAASVAQSPYNMGKFAVEYGLKAAKGQEIPKRIDTGTTLVTKENVDKFLK